YSDVFDKKKLERLPKRREYDHAINMKPEFVPTNCKLYPLAPKEDKALTEFLTDNYRKGYIRPSKSPQVSPFFFIGKKDGSLRPCQDYRKLNAYTVKDPYPLPLIPDLI
ncbi:hypothetical protein SERLA73DRAFT_16220, partial [Serpula lacrymans var. lacrymans S7.3]